MSLRVTDCIWSLLLLAVAVWIFFTASSLKSGAGLFPQIAAVLIGTSSAATLVNNVFPKREALQKPFADVHWRRLLIIVIVFVFLLSELKELGFPLVGWMLFVAAACAADNSVPSFRHVVRNSLIGAVLVLVLTGIFVFFLRVGLPLWPFFF